MYGVKIDNIYIISAEGVMRKYKIRFWQHHLKIIFPYVRGPVDQSVVKPFAEAALAGRCSTRMRHKDRYVEFYSGIVLLDKTEKRRTLIETVRAHDSGVGINA